MAEEDNKAALKDVQDIANDMRNLQTQNYLSELCTGYVPSDIPEGLKILFDIVGMLGPVIPGSILMPELRDEEDDTAEEGTSDR